nr:GDP-L-galactose phosphorylase 2 [Tanacetum cinerariifolium]
MKVTRLSCGCTVWEELLFRLEPSEDGEVQFHPSAPNLVENSPSVVATNLQRDRLLLLAICKRNVPMFFY